MSCSALSFRLGTFGAWWMQLSTQRPQLLPESDSGPPSSRNSHVSLRPREFENGFKAIQVDEGPLAKGKRLGRGVEVNNPTRRLARRYCSDWQFTTDGANK
eukprot:4649450-Amphidinium_carterae.1